MTNFDMGNSFLVSVLKSNMAVTLKFKMAAIEGLIFGCLRKLKIQGFGTDSSTAALIRIYPKTFYDKGKAPSD